MKNYQGEYVAFFEELIEEMRAIQKDFANLHHIEDIWSNSKVYEVIIANSLGHQMIPGHSGSLDAKNALNQQFEYKHYKETSSNHSWTFNDYSEQTIRKLKEDVHEVIFSHINDLERPAKCDWIYKVTGPAVAEYLTEFTQEIFNNRKMINVSSNQLEKRIGVKRIDLTPQHEYGLYRGLLDRIFSLESRLESSTKVENILTSNKFWEVLVSIPLGHQVNSEQGGRAGAHDAFDENGNDYEYKVSKSKSWNFQDISQNVLDKYLSCEEIVLAVVDKAAIQVECVWFAKPSKVNAVLEDKLREKAQRFKANGKELRRLQVSLTAGDLTKIGARQIL